MNAYSALWILMAWCFSTRASEATVLTTHPCVSRCLRVNIPIFCCGCLSYPSTHSWIFFPKTLNIVFIVLSTVESRLYPGAREGRVHISWSLPWSPGVSSEQCARASFVVASRLRCSGAQQLHCGCHRGWVLFLWILSVLNKHIESETKWPPLHTTFSSPFPWKKIF